MPHVRGHSWFANHCKYSHKVGTKRSTSFGNSDHANGPTRDLSCTNHFSKCAIRLAYLARVAGNTDRLRSGGGLVDSGPSPS
eukprot:6491107-Amphidinium_carterae.1